MGGKSQTSKASKASKPTSKKKSGKTTTAATSSTSEPIKPNLSKPSSSKQTLQPSSEATKVYGELILERILHCPLIEPHDLLPLRCVSRSYRDIIDAKLLHHVRITMKKGKTCVVTPTGHNIPGFRPGAFAALAKVGKRATGITRFENTSLLDIEGAVPRGELLAIEPYLSNLHTLRLLSDESGKHAYQPPMVGKDLTMVVYPSFLPTISGQILSRRVPSTVTKLVQHLTCAVDRVDILSSGRAPVLFDESSANVIKEVWVFTHYDIKISYGRLGLYDDRVFDQMEFFEAQLLHITRRRLMSGAGLILVDHDDSLQHINDAYQLYMDLGDPSAQPTRAQTELALREALDVDDGISSKMQLMTWDEYAATLTESEKEMETLPAEYVKKMEELPDQKLPKECKHCEVVHKLVGWPCPMDPKSPKKKKRARSDTDDN